YYTEFARRWFVERLRGPNGRLRGPYDLPFNRARRPHLPRADAPVRNAVYHRQRIRRRARPARRTGHPPKLRFDTRARAVQFRRRRSEPRPDPRATLARAAVGVRWAPFWAGDRARAGLRARTRSGEGDAEAARAVAVSCGRCRALGVRALRQQRG